MRRRTNDKMLVGVGLLMGLIYAEPLMANDPFCAQLKLSAVKRKHVVITTSIGPEGQGQVLEGVVWNVDPGALILQMGSSPKKLYDSQGDLIESGPRAYINCSYIVSVVVDSSKE